MKINRRFLNIAVVSILVAVAIGYLTYSYIQKVAQPELTEPVAYFKYNIEPDTVLTENDVVMKNTPVSLIPKTAIRSTKAIKDKRLIIKAEAGDVCLTGKIVERGDERVDTKKLWTIGIDVENISNYLGGNLKEGGEYILLHKIPGGEVAIMAKIKIVSLIDGTGKLITSKNEDVVKTINVSVENEQEVLKIAQVKGPNVFEIVDAPEGYEIKEVNKLPEEESPKIGP